MTEQTEDKAPASAVADATVKASVEGLPPAPGAERSDQAGAQGPSGESAAPAPGAPEPAAADPAVVPGTSGVPIAPAQALPLVGPEVERLPPPAYWAKRIPDTLGAPPSPVFLAVVAIFSLVADIGTKLWAEKRLDAYPGYVTVIENHLTFVLAKNRGGAWGLLQGTSENVRRPFFLLVSAAAIAFIVTLYKRLQPRQHALKWGLPLVLGGALGNVFDRIRYGHVIDFIDYRADWLRKMNELIAKYYKQHTVTDHWPTFNVADIAICVGVALMAIDMFTSKRGKKRPLWTPADAPSAVGTLAEAAPAADAQPSGASEPTATGERAAENATGTGVGTATQATSENPNAEPQSPGASG
jgi:signal peptidase II